MLMCYSPHGEKMIKSEITYDDFNKLDIRLAKILSAEPVEKTDRLIKLTLDIGEETPATVVAGIRAFYEPENLVGSTVTYLANLAPRKLRGIESRGMILAAATFDEDNKIDALALVKTCKSRNMPPGASVG